MIGNVKDGLDLFVAMVYHGCHVSRILLLRWLKCQKYTSTNSVVGVQVEEGRASFSNFPMNRIASVVPMAISFVCLKNLDAHS